MTKEELVEEELIELDGQAADSKKYICRKHIFYKRPSNYCSKETYYCASSRDLFYNCKVQITRDGKNKLILDLKKKGHQHEPPPDVLLISKMIEDIKEAAKYSGTVHMIYDRVAAKHPKAASYISLGRVGNIINHERKSYWMSGVETLESLSILLENHPLHNKYYQDIIFPDNRMEGSVLWFSDETALSRLNNAKALYIDGNFKVVPDKPESMQMWNILMDEHGSEKTCLVGFAWCTNANHGTYSAILNYLKGKAPGLEKNLEIIYTDFEQAAILAFSYQFPKVKVQGCWFHYSQAITKRWDELNLVEKKKQKLDTKDENGENNDENEENNDENEENNNENEEKKDKIKENNDNKKEKQNEENKHEYKEKQNKGNKKLHRKKAPKEILYACRNIPLLPEHDIRKGLEVIAQLIDQHKKNWPDLEKFKTYVVNQWLNKPHLLSSFGSITRTNNKSESFNHSLGIRMGLGLGGHRRPTLGNFLYNIHNIIATEAVKMTQPTRFHRINRQQENDEKNERIRGAQEKLQNHEIDVEAFLYEVMTEDMQNNIINTKGREMEEEKKEREQEQEQEKKEEEEKKRKKDTDLKLIAAPEKYEPEYGKKTKKQRKK